jgi:hypothetical protein
VLEEGRLGDGHRFAALFIVIVKGDIMRVGEKETSGMETEENSKASLGRLKYTWLLVFVLEMNRNLSVPGQFLNGRKTTKGPNDEDQTADIQRGKRLQLLIRLNTFLVVVDTDDMKADRRLSRSTVPIAGRSYK